MSIREDIGSIQLSPTEGFVVKTRILEGKKHHLVTTKVFINICHDAQVPKPQVGFDPAVVFPLIMKNEWEIPIIASTEKTDTDKKGAESFVYDCCINDECFRWILVSKDLKLILIEWCLESVELMFDVVLEREYSTPKMTKKGTLSNTQISLEELEGGFQKSLQELKQNDIQGLLMELEPKEKEEGEKEELPDLLNPHGVQKGKPLIEEINDLSLLPKKEHKETQPKTPLTLEITMTGQKTGLGHVVILESPHLTDKISIQHSASTRTIRLINKDETRTLGKNNCLDLPAPELPLDKVIMARDEHKVYVFFTEK